MPNIIMLQINLLGYYVSRLMPAMWNIMPNIMHTLRLR